jgi:hypothetical protein
MSSVPESAEVGTCTVTVMVVLLSRGKEILDGATLVFHPIGEIVDSWKLSVVAPVFLSVC